MPDFLALHAAAAPDKPAVIDDRPDGTFLQWTFAELNDRVNRLATDTRDVLRVHRSADRCPEPEDIRTRVRVRAGDREVVDPGFRMTPLQLVPQLLDVVVEEADEIQNDEPDGDTLPVGHHERSREERIANVRRHRPALQ